ncbi:MAG TPA: DNRLRE domain-containing protein [Chitinophagaceae bacterium]|nr:DNRLRE domain-containing protein [Chitinophagaceae bacterium]
MKQNLRVSIILTSFIIFLASCEKDPVVKIKPSADAGVSKTVQLPATTVSVTGSGTTTNGSISGYLWSLVTGPNVPVINSPSSTTTSITGLIAGTYIFQFAVTDNAGLTGMDTMTVLVNAAVQQTITIQPANNPFDAHVDSYNQVGGAGDQEVEIAAWTINGTPANWRAFIKFDQSQIPAGSTIISATLYLYTRPNPHLVDPNNAHPGTANAFYVERITTNWNPASFTWINQPITTTANRVTVPQSSSVTPDVTINVTGMVQDMQTSGNYGFAFRLQNETYYNARQFASSFYTNAALRPKLVITYQ